MELSRRAGSNSACNFGVMTPLVVTIDIKKYLTFFQFIEKLSKVDLTESIRSEKEDFRSSGQTTAHKIL